MAAFFLHWADVLSGILMPLLLGGTGLFFLFRLGGFWICHPFRTLRTALEPSGSGTSSFRALSVALAGPLGVGNIAGVATAIVSGGPGAVFWMWAGAFLSMSVKYMEAFLSVRHRRTKNEAGVVRYYGGAMYYMKDGLKKALTARGAAVFGGIFALFCLANSILTGTVVQVNAAASVSDRVPPVLTGLLFALLILPVTLGGAHRITALTARLIPFLSGAYLLLSLHIILINLPEVPSVFRLIFEEAFSLRPVGGGILGFTMARAIRYGVTRGIFSNEAGCGTSPTAHAAADAKSPHHQGVFGILEVFIDTVVLCTVTALVILLSEGKGTPSLDGIPLSLHAYEFFAGAVARRVLGVCIVLFAYATVICQHYYGTVALDYLAAPRAVRLAYTLSVSTACILGSVISLKTVWTVADWIISLMTVINLVCLWWIPGKPSQRDLTPR